MGKNIYEELREKMTDAVTGLLPYNTYIMTDYDGNEFMFSVFRGIDQDQKIFNLDFARPGEKLKAIANIRVHEKTTDKHLINQLCSMVLDWVSKTRIKSKDDLVDIYTKSVEDVFRCSFKPSPFKEQNVTFGVKGGYLFTIQKRVTAVTDKYSLIKYNDQDDPEILCAALVYTANDISELCKTFGKAIYDKVCQIRRCDRLKDRIEKENDIFEQLDEAVEDCSKAMKELGECITDDQKNDCVTIDLSECELEKFVIDGYEYVTNAYSERSSYIRTIRGATFYISIDKHLYPGLVRLLYVRESDKHPVELTSVQDWMDKEKNIEAIIDRLKEFFAIDIPEEPDYEQKYWDCQRRIDEYERDLRDKDNIIEKQKQSLIYLRERCDKLASEKQIAEIDLRVDLGRARNDLKAAKALISTLTANQDKINQRADDVITKNRQLQKQNDDLIRDYSKVEIKHQKATQECKRMAREIEELRCKVNRLDRSYCSSLESRSEIKNEMQKTIDKVICQRDAIEGALHSLETYTYNYAQCIYYIRKNIDWCKKVGGETYEMCITDCAQNLKNLESRVTDFHKSHPDFFEKGTLCKVDLTGYLD